jgi:hypothetical protein
MKALIFAKILGILAGFFFSDWDFKNRIFYKKENTFELLLWNQI